MIAIKGMEMPSCCADCNMTTCKGEDVPWNYVCSINLKDIDFNETDRDIWQKILKKIKPCGI